MDQANRDLLALQAEVLAALGHPLRLAVVAVLGDGEQCVCDIAAAVGAQRSNVSRHLGVLANAGVVAWRKDGLKVMYRLTTPCVMQFLSCVNRVLQERLAANAAALAELADQQ